MAADLTSTRRKGRRPTKPTSRERRLATALRKLLAEYEQRSLVGGQMANVCYNAAHRNLLESDRPALDRLRKEWDAIGRAAAFAAIKLVGDQP